MDGFGLFKGFFYPAQLDRSTNRIIFEDGVKKKRTKSNFIIGKLPKGIEIWGEEGADFFPCGTLAEDKGSVLIISDNMAVVRKRRKDVIFTSDAGREILKSIDSKRVKSSPVKGDVAAKPTSPRTMTADNILDETPSATAITDSKRVKSSRVEGDVAAKPTSPRTMTADNILDETPSATAITDSKRVKSSRVEGDVAAKPTSPRTMTADNILDKTPSATAITDSKRVKSSRVEGDVAAKPTSPRTMTADNILDETPSATAITDSDAEVVYETEFEYPDRDPDFNPKEHSEDSDTSEVFENMDCPPKKHMRQKPSINETMETSPKLQMPNNTQNQRKWDKIHYCYFCEASSTNITKHLFGPHKNETEVVRILAFPKSSKERKLALLKIRNAGDYKHNMHVLRSDTGTLITWSRKAVDSSKVHDYLPCEDCLGFFLHNNLWRHKKECPFSTASNQKRLQAKAALLLPSTVTVSKGLKEIVLPRMTNDAISQAARNDQLIIQIGEKQFQKNGHLPLMINYISQKMRELARFLIQARELDNTIVSMNDVIVPAKFPLTITCVQNLCDYRSDSNQYGNPSLALKIGLHLKKMASIKKSKALIEMDNVGVNQATAFLSLLEDNYTDSITSSAHETLAVNKINQPQVLPFTEDIMKLQDNLEKRTEIAVKTLQMEFKKASWEELNQLTLARIVLFNRRRGGETERMTLEGFQNRSNHPPLEEVADSLSPLEKKLCDLFSRVEIRGKSIRNVRTVPVLLTPSNVESINLLIQHRETACVNLQNKFLFPRPNAESLNAIRSSDVLRRFAQEADLKVPNSVTSTKLRKHIATLSQLLSLTKNDMEVMANFLGHDIEIHRSFYRLPQETLQVARMGKLLMAFNNGTVSNYKGRSLDDIHIDEDMELSEEDEPSQDEDETSQEEEVPSQQEDETSQEEDERKTDVQESHKNCENNTDVELPRKKKKVMTKISSRGKIQRLTSEQSTLLKRLFQSNIDLRRELKKTECEQAIRKFPVLESLNWEKVKNTIHNWITGQKRKSRK